MADKLKQCPFCGGESTLLYETDCFSIPLINIRCCNCRTEKTMYVDAKKSFEQNEAKAIEAWNTRPSPWHTGTPPMEKGTYLIRQDCLYVPHIVCERKRDGESLFIEGSNQIIEDGILAYQKIEPYKEANNGNSN